MQLIEDWKSSFKLLSMQVFGALGTCAVIWDYLEPSTQLKVLQTLPISPAQAVALSAVIGMFFRLIKQGKKPPTSGTIPGSPAP